MRKEATRNFKIKLIFEKSYFFFHHRASLRQGDAVRRVPRDEGQEDPSRRGKSQSAVPRDVHHPVPEDLPGPGVLYHQPVHENQAR